MVNREADFPQDRVAPTQILAEVAEPYKWLGLVAIIHFGSSTEPGRQYDDVDVLLLISSTRIYSTTQSLRVGGNEVDLHVASLSWAKLFLELQYQRVSVNLPLEEGSDMLAEALTTGNVTFTDSSPDNRADYDALKRCAIDILTNNT